MCTDITAHAQGEHGATVSELDSTSTPQVGILGKTTRNYVHTVRLYGGGQKNDVKLQAHTYLRAWHGGATGGGNGYHYHVKEVAMSSQWTTVASDACTRIFNASPTQSPPRPLA
jgi:hypothetical protein